MRFSHCLSEIISIFKGAWCGEKAISFIAGYALVEQFLFVSGIIWLAVISPGADFAMVSRLSFMEGRRAGVMAALGISMASWFHIAYAIFGLALVERFFPHLLDVLQIAGAIYLVYLGLTMMLSRPRVDGAMAAPNRHSGIKALGAGALTNGLNPKTSIFVVALYAQVIGPETSLGVQLGYGVAISLSHLLWFAAVAAFFSRPSTRARVLERQRAVNAGIGAILILLAAFLAFADLGQGGRM